MLVFPYSGIGLVAAKLLAILHPRHRLVLVARTMDKAERAVRHVEATVKQHNHTNNHHPSTNNTTSPHLIPLACDHCSLESVRTLAQELPRQLESSYVPQKWAYNGIDVLCLNAAVLVAEGSQPRYTKDGLETTFQTNHLAPFLLVNLLYPYMNPGSRIVFTTSGLHQTCVPLDLSGVLRCHPHAEHDNSDFVGDGSTSSDTTTTSLRRNFAMLDGSDFHYKRCYSLTKLCNVAVCAELHQRLQRRGNSEADRDMAPRPVTATCFSPGLMLDSDLFRHQQDPTAQLSTHLQHREIILRKAKSVEWGAGALVFVALSPEAGIHGGVYWNDDSLMGDDAVYGEHFAAAPITENVADVATRRRLWDVSCQLAGIPNDRIAS